MHNPPSSAAELDSGGTKLLWRGRLYVLAAAVLWSTSGFFAKSPLFDAWPLEQRGALLGFWRAAFAALILWPLVRRPRWQWRLLPMTGSFALMNVTFLTAMTLSTAANAIWLQSTAPLWVFFFGVVVLREAVDRRDLLPLALAASGLALILSMELTRTDAGRSPLGITLGLASGIGYAGVVLSLRSLREEQPIYLAALNHLVAAAVLLPYVLSLGNWPSAGQLVVLAGFGLLQMGLPYVLFARGLQTIPSQEAALIALLEPLLLPLWVWLTWGERTAWWTIAGGGLILLGLVLRYTVLARHQERVVLPEPEGKALKPKQDLEIPERR